MMNFLLRSAPSVSDQLAAHEQVTDTTPSSKPATTTLEGLIAEDGYPISFTNEDCDLEKDEVNTVNGAVTPPTSKNSVPIGDHYDVSAHEGFIAIPCKELPENWREAADILSFHNLDRSFIFPGEQLHILACLSASKQDTEVITPFKVAAVMSKNGNLDQNVKHPKKTSDTEPNSSPEGDNSNTEEVDEAELVSQTTTTKADVSESESILRSESHKQHTQTLLERFRNSNFFVRVTDPDGEILSKRNGSESSPSISRMRREKSVNDLGPGRISQKHSHLISVIDRGNFDANAAGGMARSTVDCCALSNGDIVVLLRVNVGNIFVKHPVLEILQFEKYQNRSHVPSENHDNIVGTNDTADPCGDLLKWLLPLDQTLLPPVRPLSPPPLSSNSSVVTNASHKSTFSASSGSQLFSFGHFRSYSMSALPQSTAPPPPASSSSKSSFDLEGWDKFSSQNLVKSQDIGSEGILSFRGVSLEPERFSVRCGLEGIYIPGRRWRRKLEIVEPLEIHSFAADCNTEELLCVQIKNVSPAHIPDIVIFLDTIAIVFEKAPKGGPPISLPIVCIEAGNEHSLPNLALRRGEEHSFVLKPANSIRVPKTNGERSSALPPYSRLGSVASSVNLPPLPPLTGEAKVVSESSDQYAVLVSCRCNYTESRLFFKQPTSWRPRLTRDLMISVASKMSEQTFGPCGGMSQLPVQVLTLQASNLTSEDLTLTVLAPASFYFLPSVVSLNSAPSSPEGPFVGFMGPGAIMQRLRTMPVVPESCKEGSMKRRSISLNEQDVSTSDVIPSTSLGCTHLWLQSTVPLGCVPSQSTATVKLELLPLTDGIVTLDTLQIAVKEKGVTYIPEHSLKIHATSSIATGII